MGGDALTYGYEFYPTTCEIEQRTSRTFQGQSCWGQWVSPSAISDHDILIQYSDTLSEFNRARHDRVERRTHRPLGIRVDQRSFSWASGNAAHSVIVEYTLSNIGVPTDTMWQSSKGTLKGLYYGIHGAVGVAHESNLFSSLDDEMVEFVRSANSDLLPEFSNVFNTVLMFDADGDPVSGGWDWRAVRDIVGLSMIRLPTPSSRVGFNWWCPRADPSLDWGPVSRASKVEFPTGGLGQPIGDRSVYQMMSNREVDYPQWEAALDHQAGSWLLPHQDPAYAADIANGEYVEFLLSAGPFDLPRDSSVTFAIAVTGGKDLHTNPANFSSYFDPYHPSVYRSGLDFSDLLRKVQWAKWTYDNPGVDTDGDGYAGDWFLRGLDTVYYSGDGVPDIRSALPPRSPLLDITTRAGRIIVHWNGRRTETEKDVFVQRVDFEGYRVYMSRFGRENDWTFVTERDLPNFARYTWNDVKQRWEVKDPPFSLSSLKSLYDTLTLARYGYPFHPDSFPVPDLRRALLEIRLDTSDPSVVDSLYRYFRPFGANNWPDDRALKLAGEAGLDVTGVIRKLHPDADPDSVALREDGSAFFPYYEYEYILNGLQVAEPIFVSITAFDNGDPATDLESQESSKNVNAHDVWPVNSAAVVESERPKPGVYPNPYRISNYYNAAGWENPRGLEPDPERARKVTFTNVPDTCTVSIWSIDGDLVRRLEHRADPASSEATVVVWNLITRNTQAVKTGIYIYSIESRFGTDVGKLVIIK